MEVKIKEGGRRLHGKEEGEVDLHVSTSMQTERQASGGEGSVLVQLFFQRFADWLPPAPAQEPIEQATHIPPSDCS